MLRTMFAVALTAFSLCAQTPVNIRIDTTKTVGGWKPVTSFFGYDEANFTYAKYGTKLIGELGSLNGKGGAPVYVRTHFMLTTGDGTAGFKWGSTNAYREDATGKPIYNWEISDRIIDTYLKAGAKPFIEIGFMPQAMSTKPDPYQPIWKPGDNFNQYYLGWAYPPKDYEKWGELIFQWVKHAATKYGRNEVATWYWEVWNEPDISYWRGTPEEYNKLYDYAADAVKRALPAARVGGPATTGPNAAKAAAFLKQFLEHCVEGSNAVTGRSGAPLDFVSFHAKGQPQVVDGRVRMGIAKNVADAAQGMRIVGSFPQFRTLPIVITESDPEGCAACSARVYPQNAYRNGPLYASYEAAMLGNVLELADSEKVNLGGMLTWAFEFEDQPYFDGYRTLATNGIDKPVLNLFRMAAKLKGNRVAVETTGGMTAAGIQKDGVRGAEPDVGAIATVFEHEMSILMWNYHDDDLPGPEKPVRISIDGLTAKQAAVYHYRIDETHSNAWTAWKKAGSPQQPTPEQYKALEAAGKLQEFEKERELLVAGHATIDVTLPRQSVSLFQLKW